MDIINTTNYLSSIRYCINNDVLNYIFDLLENEDKEILKIIKLNIHPQTKEIYKLSFSNKINELNLIFKHNSQYYSDSTVLQLALIYSKGCKNKDNSIYFPIFIE